MPNTTEMEPVAAPPPPVSSAPKAVERAVQLETDAFCVECGYNLHGQPVCRDERLNLLIARCPECGQFHPAGTGVTATKLWLQRLASLLLFFWVLIVIGVVVLASIGFGAVSVGYIEDMTYRQLMSADQKPAEWKQISLASGGTTYQVVKKGTTRPVVNWKLYYTLQPTGDDDQSPWGNRKTATLFEQGVLAGCAAALGLIFGLLLVVFLWHWKKRRYLLVTLLPLAPAIFMICVFYLNEEFELIVSWATRVAICFALWEAAWIGVGILVGRPIARGLLRMFVPPRPRQYLAFLWTIDGKSPPLPRVAA